MNTYSQEEQTEIVKAARDLTISVRIEDENLKKIESETFRLPPPPPQKRTVEKKTATANMPQEITVKYSFYSDFLKDRYKNKSNKLWVALGIAGAVLLILIILSGVIGAAIGLTILFTVVPPVIIIALIAVRYKLDDEYKREKELKNYAANNTPEMLQAREYAISEAKRKQAEYDIEYNAAKAKADSDYAEEMRIFNSKTMPDYEKEKNSWTLIRKTKINMISIDKEADQKELENLYVSTKLIPKKYQTEPALVWLYDNMSTSSWDIDRAIDMLNVDINQLQEQALIDKMKQVSDNIEKGFAGTMDRIDELSDEVSYGNDLSEEQLRKIGKARRDNNLANIISIFQRHNISKKL